MSHAFESGFFVREPAWHGLGTVVAEAPTTAKALEIAGIDWTVRSEVCYDQRNVVVPDTFLNVRDRDNAILGIVGNKYRIVQPIDALNFMDDLMVEGLTLDTAGSLHGGKRIWLLAKAPARDILGDAFDPYMVLTTSFDGSSATELMNTVTRVVCANTMDMARSNASRKFKVRHSSKLEDRRAEAQRMMKLATSYVDEIALKAEKYATRRISKAEFEMLTNELFGNPDMMTPRQVTNADALKEQFGAALRRVDLENFKGSAWQVYNAVGDFATHLDPVRKTADYKESLWESFLDGNEWLTKAELVLDEIVA